MTESLQIEGATGMGAPDIDGTDLTTLSDEELNALIARAGDGPVDVAAMSDSDLDGLIKKASGSDDFFPIPGDKPEAPKMGWGDVAKGAVSNFPASTQRFVHDMIQPVMHPVDTAQNLYSLSLGLVEHLIPGEQADEKTVQAVGDFLAERYGGVEEIKKTIAADPVGLMADASMFLSGGAGAAARVPGVAASTAVRALGTAARVIDPVNAAVQVASQGKRFAGKGAQVVIGDLGTHTGSESIKTAYDSGKTGNRSFIENLRGDVPMTAVLDDARSALSKMRQERGDAYRTGMAGVSKDQTVLNIAPVEQAIANVEGVKKFKGVDLSESSAGVRDSIKKTVEDWKALDPVEYHTPEGFDALKQKIGDIRDSTEFGSPSRKIADQAYNAVKKEIVAQAPDYAKVMKDYERASDLLNETERALSLGKKSAADTAMRKLQSVMRNNANTNYGNRLDALKKLESAGGKDLMPSLAGQAMSSLAPRGLATYTAVPATLGASVMNPWLLATLPFQSPRLMGEASYYAGAGANRLDSLRRRFGVNADNISQISEPMFQTGRLDETVDEAKGGRIKSRLSRLRVR